MDGLSEDDARWLRAAFEVARQARDEGNLPFGCVLVDDAGHVAIEQGNLGLVPVRDATAHAETLAAGRAARRYEPGELAHFTLYTSAEPCAMCAGAIYWAGIGRVVFGLSEKDLKLLTGNHPDNPTMDLPCREVFARGQRRVDVLGPELADEALAVFERFWS
ncbi:MAG: nucleoside deaminase [Acidimicrobiales bacterium]|jgi:tRNA(Arg) A34 adenosine deaminase TadA